MIPRDPNTMDPDSNPAMHPRVDNAMLPSADIGYVYLLSTENSMA